MCVISPTQKSSMYGYLYGTKRKLSSQWSVYYNVPRDRYLSEDLWENAEELSLDLSPVVVLSSDFELSGVSAHSYY